MGQRSMSHSAGGRWAWTMAVAVIAGTSPESALGQDADSERRYELFALFTNCEPVVLSVEVHNDGDALNGLDEETVTRAARSRLRSARLFVESGANLVSIYAHIVGRAFSLEVQLWKTVFDPATELYLRAVTWERGSTGTHGGDGAYVVSGVQRMMDQFLDEYLRVNEPACSL